ncbi:MAG: DUF4446 family protein [Tissierellales bacterium]|jgi:Na+-transporting methylmalonyl-CoA/oxaloacetate decarboxylase gamma subunit|nr:DUF4446 family protein [Tissierellales bacterium]
MMTYVYVLGVVSLILFILLIIALKKISKVEKKYEKLIENTNGESLDEVIINNKEDIANLKLEVRDSRSYEKKLQVQLDGSIQRIGFKRYNAFDDMGSNMSFSTALLNEVGDGIILSSLYGRDGCSMYGKSIEKGKSSYLLSDEENEVLKQAMSK